MLRSLLISIVKEVAPLFVSGYHKSSPEQKAVQFKGTVDLVTKYDIAIEEQLTLKLKAAFAGYTIIGEENTQNITHAENAIYIDPIDGTTNFVHHIPFCCISVGIFKAGKPYIGVVYNPILDECFSAKIGDGAYLNEKRISVSKQGNLQQALVATGFPYTKVERGEDYDWVLASMAKMLPVTRDIRRLGSAALDLCYVAQGVYELFYECNLKPWDVAAGLVILLEAGGKYTLDDGGVYTLQSHRIVASNTTLHASTIATLNG